MYDSLLLTTMYCVYAWDLIDVFNAFSSSWNIYKADQWKSMELLAVMRIA